MILRYSPDRYKEFVLDCIKYSFSDSGRRIAEHEAAHFNKLIELGHTADHYVIIISDSSDPFLVGASLDFDMTRVSEKDLAIAALAPKDPSIRDLRTARKVFSRQERRHVWEEIWAQEHNREKRSARSE